MSLKVHLFFRAENETRTRDPNLGKVVLYQLSYFRISVVFVTGLQRYELFLNLQQFHGKFIIFFVNFSIFRDFYPTYHLLSIQIAMLLRSKRIDFTTPERKFSASHLLVDFPRDIVYHLTFDTKHFILMLHQIFCAQCLNCK